MTIADLCLLAAVILTIVSIMPAKWSGGRDYDNAVRAIRGFSRRGCGRGRRGRT